MRLNKVERGQKADLFQYFNSKRARKSRRVALGSVSRVWVSGLGARTSEA